MINNFQMIVLYTAIIIFIIFMIFIGVILYNQKYSSVFPPIISSCPDYWIDQQDENTTTSQGQSIDTLNKQTCYNIKNLGNASCSRIMNFSEDYWQGTVGECRKYKWAKECGLTWDGITNKQDICSTNVSN